MQTTEVIIIGGSYAGLSAALTLGRSLRNVVVIDNGNPCNRQTPLSHNFLTRDGVPPAELAAIARIDVAAYDTVQFLTDTVEEVRPNGTNFEIKTVGGQILQSKKLILATGIIDILPELEGLKECWAISAIHCPYCHGYEYHSKKTALLADGEAVLEFLPLLRNLTDQLFLLTNGPSELGEQERYWLKQNQIELIETALEKLEHREGHLHTIQFQDGTTRPMDALYVRAGFRQSADWGGQTGCRLDSMGYIETNDFWQTSVPGLYAVGDNSYPMRSVSNAVAAGSFAAAMINRELASEQFPRHV